MKSVAAIDCGTNSIRLLIAKETPTGLVDLVREMRIVRLGQDVDRTGRLADTAVERTLAAVREYQEIISHHDVERTRFVGTSAMRDAHNGKQFMDSVEAIIGVRPEIIPGEEEAALSFKGAVSSLTAPAPRMIVDIGGGSTEFVYGAEAPEAAISIDMGSVRVTERFGSDFDAAAQWVDDKLDQVEHTIDFARLGALVGVAGTVTTLAAHSLGATRYQPELTHGQFLTWKQWNDAADFMKDQPVEVKAALPFMPPGRADVIGAGALIWQRIINRVDKRLPKLGGAYVSEHDILDGIALALVD